MEWEKRTAPIGNEKGVTIFRQDDIEVPKNWSQTATNIVVSKYFHGKSGSPEREGSVRQLIARVVNTIVRWGEEGGYFTDTASRDAFRDELTHLLVEQKMAFNSPVWFNVGVQAKPQCSACFINSVSDTMESIMGLTRTEGMLFKWGSGTGTNSRHCAGVRKPFGRRNRIRSGELYEGLRRFRRGDQERRQDAARGQDGDPGYRSPGHRGIHRMQSEGREESHVLIDKAMIPRSMAMLQFDLLSECQSLGARE